MTCPEPGCHCDYPCCANGCVGRARWRLWWAGNKIKALFGHGWTDPGLPGWVDEAFVFTNPTPAQIEEYTAELPDPGVLDEYEAIVPGARLRILRMRHRSGTWDGVLHQMYLSGGGLRGPDEGL